MAEATILLAFLAGLASFLSPCIVPVLPGFVAFLSGERGMEEKEGRKKSFWDTRKGSILGSVFFVLGFSTVFSGTGVLLNGALASVSYGAKIWLSRIGGVAIIFFALHLLGIVRIPFLMMEHKLGPRKFQSRALTAFFFGASFAAGWSPCVGAILGSILTLAITSPGSAFALLFAYSLGLGLPFLIVGLFTDEFVSLLSKSKRALLYFNKIVGILLLILGILVFFDMLSYVSYLILPPFL